MSLNKICKRPTNRYLNQIVFFLPELKSFLTKKQYRKEVGKIKFIENLNMDDPDDVKIFESKREIGENGILFANLFEMIRLNYSFNL